MKRKRLAGHVIITRVVQVQAPIFIHAEPSNFHLLVQKFTGFNHNPSDSSSSSSSSSASASPSSSSSSSPPPSPLPSSANAHHAPPPPPPPPPPPNPHLNPSFHGHIAHDGIEDDHIGDPLRNYRPQFTGDRYEIDHSTHASHHLGDNNIDDRQRPQITDHGQDLMHLRRRYNHDRYQYRDIHIHDRYQYRDIRADGIDDNRPAASGRPICNVPNGITSSTDHQLANMYPNIVSTNLANMPSNPPNMSSFNIGASNLATSSSPISAACNLAIFGTAPSPADLSPNIGMIADACLMNPRHANMIPPHDVNPATLSSPHGFCSDDELNSYFMEILDQEAVFETSIPDAQ